MPETQEIIKQDEPESRAGADPEPAVGVASAAGSSKRLGTLTRGQAALACEHSATHHGGADRATGSACSSPGFAQPAPACALPGSPASFFICKIPARQRLAVSAECSEASLLPASRPFQVPTKKGISGPSHALSGIGSGLGMIRGGVTAGAVMKTLFFASHSFLQSARARASFADPSSGRLCVGGVSARSPARRAAVTRTPSRARRHTRKSAPHGAPPFEASPLKPHL